MERDRSRGSEPPVELEAAAAPPPVRSPLLSEIGAIVRKARAKRGMTR